MDEPIQIEVTYAEPDRQFLKSLEVPAGTTAQQAVALSGVFQVFAHLADETSPALGIFGKKCPVDQVLSDGDRVEIYRPLKVDPKEARRLKAEADERKQTD